MDKTIPRKIDIGRRAFELFLEGDCKDTAIYSYAKQLGISISTLKTQYMNFYINQSVRPKPTDEQLEQYNRTILSRKLDAAKQKANLEFINELLKQHYGKEILQFVVNSPYSISEIFGIIAYYTKHQQECPNLQSVLRINRFLKDHLNDPLLKDKLNQKSDQEKLLQELTKKIIVEFISGDDSFETIFAQYKNKITHDDFKEQLEILKTSIPEDRKLIALLAARIEQRYSLYEDLVPNIITLIKEAKAAGESLNILDYYRVTNFEPNRLLEQAKKMAKAGKIEKAEFYLIHSALARYEKGDPQYPPEHLIGFNYSYDGYTLTMAQKQKIVEYIESIPAPLTKNTFCQAYADYLKGKISLGNTKSA